MWKKFDGAEHLIRLVVVTLVAVLLFFALRKLMVPAEFGKYGHYRPAALADIASKTPVYAGRDACADCHEETVKLKSEGKHANIACETCHGASAVHAADSEKQKPLLPDTKLLCPSCHESSSAKPARFPQVNSKEHAEGAACGTCHNPHQPEKTPEDKS
jgi:transcription elongation factor Elf1